jgi:putative acetyltransferase
MLLKLPRSRIGPNECVAGISESGIGSRLVRDGLEACKRKGYDAVVVLGHTAYYPRFGFSRATDYGLDNEYEAVDSFMVLELKIGVLQTIGLVKYAPEFKTTGC